MNKKVALIVGATRGIGAYIANGLNEFNISACGRSFNKNSQKEVKRFGDLIEINCDVKDTDDVQHTVQRTIDHFGKIDLLIYNSGVMEFDCISNTDMSSLDTMYSVMVKGYLEFVKSVIPIMIKQNGGHIINISSTRAISPAPGKAGYSAMKRAAMSITESIIAEHSKDGIVATSINCGLVYTESSKRMIPELQHKKYITEDDILKTIRYVLSLSKYATTPSIRVGGMV